MIFQHLIKLESDLKFFLLAFIWAVFIAVVSFMPNESLPKLKMGLLQPDKFAHAGVYFLLTIFLYWGFRWKISLDWQKVALCIGISCLYGFLIELGQYFLFPYRSFEFLDIIANIIGSLLSLIVAFFLIK